MKKLQVVLVTKANSKEGKVKKKNKTNNDIDWDKSPNISNSSSIEHTSSIPDQIIDEGVGTS